MTFVRWLFRGVLLAVAVGALLYVGSRMPDELRADPIVTLSERILGGSDYDPKSLERLEPFLAAAERESRCGRTRGPLSAIRSYEVQQAAVEGDIAKAQEAGRAAIRDLRQKLGCSPADGLSWFTLFLMESSLSGRARANLPFLLMSYQVAPNEGQLMRSRAQVATALLPLVGPELQAHIRSEFIHIARDDYQTAIGILLGSGESLKRLLLPLLENVSIEQRQLMALRLSFEKSDIVIPGAPSP